jgi:hypothetical protein
MTIIVLDVVRGRLRFEGGGMEQEDSNYTGPGESVIDALAVALPPVGAAAQPSLLTGAQIALYTGWTMASLIDSSPVTQTPVISALSAWQETATSGRRDVELCRLAQLIGRLASQLGYAREGFPASVPDAGLDEIAFRESLVRLNLEIVKALPADSPEIVQAYELGRSLRETVVPPHDMPSPSRADWLVRRLARERIVKLQRSLLWLAPQLPVHAAGIVATSVGRWCEFSAVTLNAAKPLVRQRAQESSREEVADAMYRYLHPQADIWLMCLLGGHLHGLLTSEGYAGAAESALRRSAKTLRAVMREYWVVWVVLVAITIGVLYLGAANLHGAAKVWTSIAAIAGSLGLTAKLVGSLAAPFSMLSSLAAEAERPVYSIANEDAMAWLITSLPPVRLTARGARYLRRAGISAPSHISRV